MRLPYPSPPPMTCEQVRRVDAHAIRMLGLPGLVLMENAARSVAEEAYALLPAGAARVVALCGPGNNGGDGIAAARHLAIAGVPVSVVLTGPPERVGGDAAVNVSVYQRMRQECIDASTPRGMLAAQQRLSGAAVVIDALLGTGSSGAPRGVVAELIGLANQCAARRLAVDLPSGLDGDTGAVRDPCFIAEVTVTLVAPKAGFLSAEAARVLGRVVVAGIGAPPDAATPG